MALTVTTVQYHIIISKLITLQLVPPPSPPRRRCVLKVNCARRRKQEGGIGSPRPSSTLLCNQPADTKSNASSFLNYNLSCPTNRRYFEISPRGKLLTIRLDVISWSCIFIMHSILLIVGCLLQWVCRYCWQSAGFHPSRHWDRWR